jgi:predicted membrane protein
MESVAGTVRFEAAIAPRATVSIETVSGAVQLLLPAGVGAEFAVSSFSGQINNELGPAAQKSSKWTPQTELNFTTGAGGARVTVETLSGAIEIRKRP